MIVALELELRLACIIKQNDIFSIYVKEHF